MSNYRVNIEGDVTGSSIAIGKQASAGAPTSDSSAEILASRLLDDFIATLERYDGSEPCMHHMRELAESAQEEITTGQPDKGRIRARLDRIHALISTMTSAVAGTADLADAIDKIRAAVGRL